MIFKIARDASRHDLETFKARLEREGGIFYELELDSQHLLVTENVREDVLGSSLPPFMELQPPVDTPYQVTSRRFKSSTTVIDLGSVHIGDGSVQIIAGPCAVENQEQMQLLGPALHEAGVVLLRGGLFKPRTSPYSFQGMGQAGIPILAELKQKYGFKIVTEALDEDCLDQLLPIADVIQLGSRNMQNYSFLKRLGGVPRPILLKRGMAATLTEFLMAAEYIVINGNPQVILCERGIRTISDYTRNTLDLSAVPLLKKETHLPVIVDPSHATGRGDLVRIMARAAVAAGADGLMVEVHPDPGSALSDGHQSIDLPEFRRMLEELRRIALAMDTDLAL